MRLFVLIWLTACICMVASQQPQYFDFVANTSVVVDPTGLLNHRFLTLVNGTTDRVAYFRSERSTAPHQPRMGAIDTIGGAIAYQTLPMAVLAYWDYNSTWPSDYPEIFSASDCIGAAFASLIERDSTDKLVKFYSFTQAPTNTSAGAEWDFSSGSNPNGTLQWVQLSTSISVSAHSSDQFQVDIVWLLTEELGTVDLGSAKVSPRSLSAFVRVTGYVYDSPDNALSVRIISAHESSAFVESRGVVSSGDGLGQIYTWLNPHSQILSSSQDWTGSPANVTSTDWQSSPGLRNAVSQSRLGDILIDMYGANWDVQFMDVTIVPDNTDNFIYSFTLGAGAAFLPPGAPIASPSEEPHYSPDTTPSSSSSRIISSCTIIFISLFLMAHL